MGPQEAHKGGLPGLGVYGSRPRLRPNEPQMTVIKELIVTGPRPCGRRENPEIVFFCLASGCQTRYNQTVQLSEMGWLYHPDTCSVFADYI